MKLFSFAGDTIFDPFLGSGTTLITAMEHQRNAIGLELEANYCDLIVNRVYKECRVKLQKSPPLEAEKYTMPCWKV